MKHNWSNASAMPIHGARRNGARWTDAEVDDLRRGWLSGDSVLQLAVRHERLQNAVEIRLCRTFGVSFMHELPTQRDFERVVHSHYDGGKEFAGSLIHELRKAVTPAWAGSKSLWITHTGKEIPLHEMDLDHMLNAVNDMNFRVAQMRHMSTNVLGARNRNVSAKTIDAFEVVKPHDVFPIYPHMVLRVKKAFHERFDVTLRDVRVAVYAAWGESTPIYDNMGAAVRFYLNSTGIPRLEPYLKSFDVGTDEQYRQMCWNLRADQDVCWAKINYHGLTKLLKTVPPSRLHSAIKAIMPVRVPQELVLDEWFDHQF